MNPTDPNPDLSKMEIPPLPNTPNQPIPPGFAPPPPAATQPTSVQEPMDTTPPDPNQAMQGMSTVDPSRTSKPNMRKLTLLVPIFLIVLVGFLLGAGILIAQEKIPVSNKDLQMRIASIVFKLPFVEKTPKFVVLSSINAFEKIKTGYTDASFAVQGVPLPEPFTDFPLEMSYKGSYDLSDPNNPRSDGTFNLIGQFELDSRALEDRVYFKVNKLPSLVLGFLGIANTNSFDVLLNQWVEIDSTKLNTDAKMALQKESSDTKAEVTKKYEDFALTVLEKDLLPLFTMTDETIDGQKTHKLYMELDKNEFAELSKNISKDYLVAFPDQESKLMNPEKITPPEELEVMKLTLWVNSKNYNPSKAEIYAKISPDKIASNSVTTIEAVLPSSEKQSTVEFVGSVKFTRLGEKFEFQKPEGSIPLEEYMIKAAELFGDSSLFGSLGTPDFAKVKSDIQLISTSTDLYFATNNSYPKSIYELANSNLTNVNILSSVSKDRIQYKTTTDGEAVIIYSTVQDPENEEAPYYTIIVSNTIGRSAKNYSGIELNSLLEEIGVAKDSLLETRTSGNSNLAI